MPKKGTPEYEEWLRKYHLKRKGKVAQTALPGVLPKKETKKRAPKKEKPQPTRKGDYEPSPGENVQYILTDDSVQDAKVTKVKDTEHGRRWLVQRADGEWRWAGKHRLLPASVDTEKKPTEDFDGMVFSKGDQLVPKGSISYKIEQKVAPIVDKMNKAGIRVDRTVFNEISAKYYAERKTYEAEVLRLAGGDLNLNKPVDVGAVLYDKLGAPQGRLTTGGSRSTDKVTLALMMKDEPRAYAVFAKNLAAWRTADRIIKQTILPVQGQLTDDNDIVRTTFESSAAVSGRFGSSQPNLQQVTMEVRRAFVPRKGHTFISIDYSQIEYRIFASLAGDPKLKKVMEAEDIHRSTAAEIFGIPEEDVSEEQRDQAKMTNFGLLYGMSESGLADRLGISKIQAAQFYKAYFDRFPEAFKFVEATKNLITKKGESRNFFGRIRKLGRPGRISQKQINEGFNTMIQGMGAEMIKLAMIRTDRVLPSLNSRDLLTLHDELLFEVPDEKVGEATVRLRKEMEAVTPKGFVPLRVKVSTGSSWGELKKVA